jgi:nitronate monooxygenase
MAGGGSSPELIRAATAAGAFAFLPAGYRTARALASDIRALKASGLSFGVNLFKVDPIAVSPERYASYVSELQSEADPYGMSLADIPQRGDDDEWEAKLTVLLGDPVPWVSTTFGVPTAEEVAALRGIGSRVAVTVTTVAEARRAERLGIDLLVVQGPNAGGHSGTFDPGREFGEQSTPELIAMIRAGCQLPIIAGGGIDGPSAVRGAQRGRRGRGGGDTAAAL